MKRNFLYIYNKLLQVIILRKQMPKYSLKLNKSQYKQSTFQSEISIKGDFYIAIQQRKLHLPKQFLIRSPFLLKLLKQKNILKTDGPININQNFELSKKGISVFTLQKILLLFRGEQVAISRTQQIITILKCIKTLELQELFNNLISDISQNFDQYSFFTLLILSRKFDICWLNKKCLSTLVSENFQEFNFNRYDLIESSEENFRYILKIHQDRVLEGKCKGQSQEIIKQIIKQYYQANNVFINPFEYLNQGLQVIQQVQEADSLQCYDDKSLSYSMMVSTADESFQARFDPLDQDSQHFCVENTVA